MLLKPIFNGMLWAVVATAPVTAADKATETASQGKPQMRLLNDLDFPDEGYCIDVVGVGRTARTDLPLVLHNCLPLSGAADRIAEENDERIYMPAYDACVTAFGVLNPLPGVPVILRKCGRNERFLEADRLQKFTRTSENQLKLQGTDLCLTGGAVAGRTYSKTHRWRTLTLELCAETPRRFSVWK